VLFGAHVSASGGISSAIERGAEIGCDAIQIFTQSPRMWRPTPHTEEALSRFRELRAESAIEAVVCHALYLVNLASPDRVIRTKSVRALQATLETAVAIEADGVVFHVGSHLGSGMARGLRRVVPALRGLLELTTDRTWLLLENSAGAGGTIGRSVEELETLFDKLDRHRRLGLCIDSCHWWVSGVDVSDPDTLAAAVADLDERIGLERLRALHVNDAVAELGSNRDRHASVGDGLLGERLGVFLAEPAFQQLPAILETPGPEGYGPDLAEMRRLRDLHRRPAPRGKLKRRGA
jgi:deoxyribonuclease-4